MATLTYHGTDIHFYTITDMCHALNKSRPYIKKILDEIQQEYGEELFQHHSCYSRLEEHLKRPALYVSEDIYQLIEERVHLDQLKKKMIQSLPDNTYELKRIIIKQQLFFIQQLRIQSKPLVYRQEIEDLKRGLHLEEY